MELLPQHLRRYVVEQHYEKYTPVDQAVWRFILRQLRSFLRKHAHESYLDGLQKTGIEVERIPHITEISEKLAAFGWRAIPVSGFIPPAAFMELQSLGVLPIASDMRSVDHLMYTPAPDIVHEAAGHAPMLIQPEFSKYLREYATVARKAILSREDLDLYEAIRDLSDLKENSSTTPEQVAAAQSKLDQVAKSITFFSEAAELARMNWWTAEYGLIGDLESPKIFGAGLLSSVGEAKICLSSKVKKMPLTIECIKTSYDITEPQPQLFVAADFKVLSKVLHEMAEQMAFQIGGLEGLNKALRSKTVNTAQWNSGLQVGGELTDIRLDKEGLPAYLKFQGPCQLAFQDLQLPNQGILYHANGFSSPVGFLKGQNKCLSQFSELELQSLGCRLGGKTKLEFTSGVIVEGIFDHFTARDGKILILTFRDCLVTMDDLVFFEPAWGLYDMAVGSQVTSVFGGPPDRENFGQSDDFVAKQVPERPYTDEEKSMHVQYERLRALREEGTKGDLLADHVRAYLLTHDQLFPLDWLFRIEALELLVNRASDPDLERKIRADLEGIRAQKPATTEVIDDGIALAYQL